MLKRLKKFLCLLLIVLACLPVSAATRKVTLPAQGTVSGKKLYCAFGCDGGGDLYRYDISTGEQKLLSEGKCSYISKKGKYLYFTKNLYGGSDATDYRIFRIKTSGKGEEELSSGYCPVILKDQIFYIGTEHRIVDGYEQDVILGIFSMDLEGDNKTCLYETKDISALAGGEDCLYFRSYGSPEWQCFKLKTGEITPASPDEWEGNASREEDSGITSVTGGGCTFTCEGNTVYRSKGTEKTPLMTPGGRIRKMFFSHGYLIAVSEESTTASAWLIRKNGEEMREIASWPLVSGDWNY